MYKKKVITKYFSKDVLQHIKRGSFRFGSLASYRREEGKQSDTVAARLSDPGEGIMETDYHFRDGLHNQQDIPGISMTNVTIINCGPLTIKNTINEFVFCATKTQYRPKHHRTMLDGGAAQNSESYSGNGELTHYAEIDLDKFLLGLKELAPRHSGWKSEFNDPESLFFNGVDYGERASSVQVTPEQKIPNSLANRRDNYLRTIFVKPERFSPEEEIRIVLRAFRPGFVPEGVKEMVLCGKALKRATIRIGDIDGNLY